MEQTEESGVLPYLEEKHQSLDAPASYTFLDTGTTQSTVNTDHPATDTSQQVVVLGFTDLITTDNFITGEGRRCIKYCLLINHSAFINSTRTKMHFVCVVSISP